MIYLRRLIPADLYYQLYRLRNRDQIQRGIPEGLQLSILEGYCRDQLGEPLGESSFMPLSGWKTRGSYRIFLKTVSGKKSSLIFKYADHSYRQIPAARGLPVKPGPSEFEIYRFRTPRLASYLPEVYYCAETQRHIGFKYVLEDLRPAYRPIQRKDDIYRAATILPSMHNALESVGDGSQTERLINFDGSYFPALVEYAKVGFSQHRPNNGDAALLRSVAALWEELLRYHDRLGREGLQAYRKYIHGDYNRSNIHIHINPNRYIKIVDWEWAGWGYPHADFAALSKHTSEELERNVLDIILAAYPDLSSSDNTRLYRWCQIERGLLDAAFMAHLHQGGNPTSWITGYIRASLRMVLRAYEHLRTIY